MKMKDFKTMGERRRQERFLHERALADLKKHGAEDEILEAIEGLLSKGMVEAEQMESGEFVFTATELGKKVIKASGE